jgi:prevent-host-death family protein
VDQVNTHEAKTHLSKLLERVERGEEITIARAGKPVARLVPVAAARRARAPGYWRGRVVIPPSFDEDDELVRSFNEGAPDPPAEPSG